MNRRHRSPVPGSAGEALSHARRMLTRRSFPDTRHLGDGTPRARDEVMRWAAFLNADMHRAFKPIFTPHRFLAALELLRFSERLRADPAAQKALAIDESP
ncbi:hypothetical protein WME73_08590 [Sorangium sp. So ce302]|uniref:hypothetical protein n=1 Tax=Sorangium sp. So ce302 TaxID=3133297 RepID=UPI003F63BCEF